MENIALGPGTKLQRGRLCLVFSFPICRCLMQLLTCPPLSSTLSAACCFAPQLQSCFPFSRAHLKLSSAGQRQKGSILKVLSDAGNMKHISSCLFAGKFRGESQGNQGVGPGRPVAPHTSELPEGLVDDSTGKFGSQNPMFIPDVHIPQLSFQTRVVIIHALIPKGKYVQISCFWWCLNTRTVHEFTGGSGAKINVISRQEALD